MSDTKHKPATALPWTLREPRRMRGTVMGKVFIEAPKERAREPMSYGLEVLGDDYTGYGDDEAREQDVRYVNHAAHAYPKLVAALQALIPFAKLGVVESGEGKGAIGQARKALNDAGEALE